MIGVDLAAIKDAGLAESQRFQWLDLFFTAASIATNGSILAMSPVQSSAAKRALLVVGNGDSSTATPTLAVVQDLVRHEDDRALSLEETSLATGVRNYLAQVQDYDGADGNEGIAFAIKCDAKTAIAAELRVFNNVASTALVGPASLPLVGPSLDLTTVGLGSNSRLVKADGTTEIALTTDTLVTVKGVVLGAFTQGESTVAPIFAAGQLVHLRLLVKI